MPIFLKLATRAKGLLTIAAGAFLDRIWSAIRWLLEWLADKIYGDAAYKWVADAMTPIFSQPWLYFLLDWPLRLSLIGLGFYFVLRPDKRAKLAGIPDASKPAQPEPTKIAPAPKPEPLPASSAPISTQAPSSTIKATPRPIRPEAFNQIPKWQTLFKVLDNGGIELAFAPDTAKFRRDTFVLLLYAYYLLYGDDKISARRIYGDMNNNFNKIWKRFQQQEASVFELIGAIHKKDAGQEAIDDRLVERVDLATTPSYMLTEYGYSHAYELARSLIARA